MEKRKWKRYLLIFIGLSVLFEVIRSFYALHTGMNRSLQIVNESNISIKTAIDKEVAKQKADSLKLNDGFRVTH